MKKIKRWKLGVATTLMIWAVLFIIFRAASESHPPVPILKKDQKLDDIVPIQTKPALPQKNSQKEKEFFTTANDNHRSAATIAIINDWFTRTGYDTRDLNVYRTYSANQLLNLAASGDVHAMEVIAENYIGSGNLSAAKPYVDKAIIYGSLRAIGTAAIISGPPIYEGTQAPYEESKMQLKESFAYCELTRLRGDNFNADSYIRANLQSFENIYKTKNSISSDDEKWIQSRAKELYEYYQAERNKLSLGDFDNDTPKEVKDFLEK